VIEHLKITIKLRFIIATLCVGLSLLNLAAGMSVCFAASADRPRDLTDLPLEELMKVEVSTVQGASKYEQRISDAPASVSIVTSEDIKHHGYRTLADVLNSVQGFYITYDRNYNYLGARGFARPGDYNTRMLMLVDGHRINNNIYDTAAVGSEFIIDIDLIDRVEVIRGPGSSLYGSNAFFGVINVVTKRPSALKGLEVSLEAGSSDTYKERVSFGHRFGSGLEMVLSATNYRSKGGSLYYKEYDSPETNFGRSDGNDSDAFKSFFADFKFSGLRVQGAYAARTKGIPTGAWNTVFDDDRTKVSDTQGYIDVRYEKKFEHDQYLSARLFYDYYRYDGKYIIDYPPLTMNKDLAVGKWWGGEAYYSKKILDRHTIMAGAEYRDNFLQKQRNYDENPYAVYIDDIRGSYSVGAYLQGEFALSDRIILNAGARYDHYKDFSGRLNPRVAMIFNPFDATTLKLIYGEAYRIPNTYELYYTDGGTTQKANPGLDPETVRTYEIALEQYIYGFRVSLSGFYYDVRNLIAQQLDTDGLMVFNNTGKAEGKGIEFEIEKKWSNGITGRLSYSFQEMKDLEEGAYYENFPRHLVKFNTFVPIIKKKLGAGADIRYASSRKNLDGTWDGGYTIVNATLLSEKIIGDLDLSFSVYNMFDKKYSDPSSRELRQSDIGQDGRTFRLKAVYRF